MEYRDTYIVLFELKSSSFSSSLIGVSQLILYISTNNIGVTHVTGGMVGAYSVGFFHGIHTVRDHSVCIFKIKDSIN